MIFISKNRIEFFDKLRKMLFKWSVKEDEANEFVFQVANANIPDELILDGVKYNLGRWQVPEDEQEEFMEPFVESLDDESDTLCRHLRHVEAAVLLDNGLVMSFHSAK